MTPLRRRLLFRDLSAAGAFGSMAVSGELPIWTLAIFGAALAGALAGYRPLERAPRASALVLLAAAIALYATWLAGRSDLVVASCAFAGLIAAHRMLSAPSPTADGQIHLTSLLMLSGGAALSGELSFALCLALFAVFGTLSLGLAVLGDGPLPKAAGRQLAAGALMALAGSATFFVFFPRLSWNFAARHAARGLGGPVTGFADRIELGGSTGAIKTSARIVLRARLSPAPEGDQLKAYWVGRAFDTFDGRNWRAQETSHRPKAQVTLLPGSDHLVSQRIELLPSYGSRTLVALDRPAFYGSATTLGPNGNVRTELIETTAQEVRFATPGTSYSYYAYSLAPEEAAGHHELDTAPYLQLPQNLDPRIARLAQTLGGGSRAPREVARTLESALRTQYSYSLELGPDSPDPLATFLFERRAGHCEYFATALAVLLRERGIPSRVMAGFYGGERSGDEFVVRAGDAHAWVEAWIDGRFVHLDATPEANRSAATSRVWSWLTAAYEALDAQWRAHVLDYSFRDQMDLASKLVSPPSLPKGLMLPPHLGRWMLALALVLVSWMAARWAVRPRAPSSEATRLREALDRLTAPVRRPGEPLEEAQRRLQAARHPLAPALSSATRRYLDARFGNQPLSPRERRRMVSALREAVTQTRRARAGLRPEPRG